MAVPFKLLLPSSNRTAECAPEESKIPPPSHVALKSVEFVPTKLPVKPEAAFALYENSDEIKIIFKMEIIFILFFMSAPQ